uniref:Uncharacterized protein n=1 Tax=Anguilla anguilla TaxID=7936 RepID=A0A0E9T895_ANGAN
MTRRTTAMTKTRMTPLCRNPRTRSSLKFLVFRRRLEQVIHRGCS